MHTPLTKINVNSSRWTLENGYRNECSQNDYPLRTFDSGRKGALELILTSRAQDIDVVCDSRTGFRLFLSAQGESTNFFDDLSTEYFEDIEFTIIPKVTNITKEVRKYEPLQRGCIFNAESSLRFFKIYTLNNCWIECLANITKETCGCVSFSMPSMHQL